jgi:hypothetical protein
MRASTFVLLLFSAGCAGISPYQSAGPLFDRLAEPVPDAAVVYIMRPTHKIGSAIWPNLFVDDKKVADPKNGTFTIIRFAPGTYQLRTATDPQFWASEDWPSKASVQFEAGRRYFVELSLDGQTSTRGVVTGTPALPIAFAPDSRVTGRNLRLISETAAMGLLRELRYEAPLVDAMR